MDWTKENNSLNKTFTLNSYSEIVDFLKYTAAKCDEMDHHPDVHIHSYKKLKISLTTHSEGKVSELDYELAQYFDEAFKKFSS